MHLLTALSRILDKDDAGDDDDDVDDNYDDDDDVKTHLSTPSPPSPEYSTRNSLSSLSRLNNDSPSNWWWYDHNHNLWAIDDHINQRGDHGKSFDFEAENYEDCYVAHEGQGLQWRQQ